MRTLQSVILNVLLQEITRYKSAIFKGTVSKKKMHLCPNATEVPKLMVDAPELVLTLI